MDYRNGGQEELLESSEEDSAVNEGRAIRAIKFTRADDDATE